MTKIFEEENLPVAWMFTYYSRSPDGPEVTESITQRKEWLDTKVKDGAARNIRPLFVAPLTRDS